MAEQSLNELPHRSFSESLGASFASSRCIRAPLDCNSFAVPIGLRGGTCRFPIFWHDPAWHIVDRERASEAATQSLDAGVPTALLQIEMTDSINRADNKGTRILPYRADRFGVTPADFDAASVIDLRMTHSAHSGTPPRYGSSQLHRWVKMPDRIDKACSLDAPSWPADVPEADLLVKKVEQLRRLSARQAAIWVTVCPTQLGRLTKPLQQAAPDVIVLECRRTSALFAKKAIQCIASWAALPQRPRLGVVANIQDAADVVLLMTLGTDWVAIDSLVEASLSATVAVKREATFPTSSFFAASAAPPKPRYEIQSRLLRLVDDCWSTIAGLGVSNRSELDLSTVLMER